LTALSDLTPSPTPKAFVVLGYGCHLTLPVRRFLDAVADDILAATGGRSESGDPPLLITSGGFTNQRTAPGISEARRFAEALFDRGVGLPVVLDEAARTTLENLRGVGAILEMRGIAGRDVVVCCDAIRQDKIRYVARRLWRSQPTLWLYDLDRTKVQRWIQRTGGLLFDAAALRWRLVEELGLRVIDARNARS